MKAWPNLKDEKEITRRALEVLKSEVHTLDLYVRGDVWGYQIIETCCECGKDNEILENVYGFYGETLEETGLKDNLTDFSEEEIEAAWDKRHDD